MADLPRGWNRHTDAQGRVYYHDTNTNTTSWTPPPPPPSPSPSEPATAPPLSSADSYSSVNQYPQNMNSYALPPGLNNQHSTTYPSSLPPQSSMPIPSHQHPPSGPGDYPGLPPQPSVSAAHSQQYPPPSQPYSSQSQPYPSQSRPYPPQSQPYPSQSPPYPSQSQSYPTHVPSHAPSYPSHRPPPGSAPNGGAASHPDIYGAPPPGSHAPPPSGAHGSLYGPGAQPGYPPPSQPGYPPASGGYAPPSHGGYAPPSHGPPGGSSSGGHPPPPGAYAPQPPGHGTPPMHPLPPPGAQGGYGFMPPGQGTPPMHPLPPPGAQGGYGTMPPGQGTPPMHPQQPPPPKGYPVAPAPGGQQPMPPHQPSYQPRPPDLQTPPLPPGHQPPPPGYHPPSMMHAGTGMSGMTSAMSQLSMGMGSNAKVVPISLEFRAVGLRDRDLIGKSDPVLHVLQPKDYAIDQTKVSQWKRIGSTEALKNNTNPTWVQRVKVKYYFERHQPLRFDLIDIDNWKTMQGDHLGFATTTLAEIVRNGVARLTLQRKPKGGSCGELTVRAHDENAAGKVRLHLSLSGKNLDKKDFMGKSDPYYKLFRVLPGTGGTSMLYKSEEKKNDCNPTWKPHTLMLSGGGVPWTQISMKAEVYDWDKYTPHDLIGEATFSLNQLTTTGSFPLINMKKQAKKGGRYKNSGELCVHRADAAELASFVSYLQGGLRLDFIVAVDFTASNRPVNNPQSLHYMGDPQHPSQYYQALHGIGTILSGYLVDGYITALGFGAKLPGLEEASFDFALNGQSDARVLGVQGLLAAYQTALSNVKLSGPTNFTPMIRNAMNVAGSTAVSQTNQHFAVLVILTDGIVSDLPSTIDSIIEASQNTPIAIVIVGVGSADFKAMERLDGDNFKLRNDKGDKIAKHDIVQFTKYDPTKPIEYLASDVLQEVPQLVVEFMTDAGVRPNPLPAQPPVYR